MKKEFSTKWKSSKQPAKQRKYRAKAPIHIKRKFVSVNLSKDLRKKHGKRNVKARTGDTVKILRGKFRLKRGKITKIYTKLAKLEVENIQIKKIDGSKINVKLDPSNLQIIELNLDDKKRFTKMKNVGKTSEKKEASKEEEKTKTTKKEESKENTKEQK